MLITESFVLLNLPKTGSTFARNAIKEIHSQRLLSDRLKLKKSLWMKEYTMPMIYNVAGKRRGRHSQHGIYCQIPHKHKDKPVISVIRNPFDHIVSVYEFKFWREHPWFKPEKFVERYPDFPHFDFPRFLEFYYDLGFMNLNEGKRYEGPIGTQSMQFLKFYSKDQSVILDLIEAGVTKLDHYKYQLADVHYLHQENLDKELYDLLIAYGYSPKKIAFILEKEKENVSEDRSDKHWKDYYNDHTKSLVLEKEKLLFDLFPEYKAE